MWFESSFPTSFLITWVNFNPSLKFWSIYIVILTRKATVTLAKNEYLCLSLVNLCFISITCMLIHLLAYFNRRSFILRHNKLHSKWLLAWNHIADISVFLTWRNSIISGTKTIPLNNVAFPPFKNINHWRRRKCNLQHFLWNILHYRNVTHQALTYI
jgi:hypothetical protein